MSDNTKIEWADATANYVNGCSVVSPGCTNCYAMRLAGTRMKDHPTRIGLIDDSKAGPVWNGTIRTNDNVLTEVLGWAKPRRIFWNAHGDLFHENVPDEAIDRQFAVMALTPQHIHMVLTKRPERMREYLTNPETPFWRIHLSASTDFDGREWDWISDKAPRCSAITQYNLYLQAQFPLPNVWLGTSVEDQPRADERIPELLATPAAVRFISAEPLLGPVDLSDIGSDGTVLDPECWGDCDCDSLYGRDAGCRRNGGDGMLTRKIDWVIVGGESGPGARPMHPDWARSLRDQCAAAGVPFHFKQWGEWEVSLDRERDDPDWRADYTNDYVDRGKSKWLNLAGGCGFHGDRFHVMRRVGKKAAGRLLDGVQHDGFPA